MALAPNHQSTARQGFTIRYLIAKLLVALAVVASVSVMLIGHKLKVYRINSNQGIVHEQRI
jgi:hypothetical protein